MSQALKIPAAGSEDIHAHRVLILDFGSQYTQLIARRVREAGVYSEILPWDVDESMIRDFAPDGIVLSGGPSGDHKIEGVGAGFVVPLWKPSLIDEIARVSTDEAMAMARRLAKDEAIFAGTSTGGNLVAALDVARRLGPDTTVVTLMCDSGLKYLSTPLYRR